jgi:hypothetical protein
MVGTIGGLIALTPVIGWSVTAIALAGFIALAVIVWRRLKDE